MRVSAQGATKEKLWTAANVVTLVRICAIPVFVMAIISPWPSWVPEWENAEIWKPWIAAALFIILAATDALDGYLARSRGEVTNFGKFMDPLADKILVAAALLALIELSVLPSWVVLVILCREFIVSGIRMVAASQGMVIAASYYGKVKTVTQIIAIVLFIIKDSYQINSLSSALSEWLYLLSWAVMFVALAFTVISMLDYFVKAREVLGFSKARSKKADAFDSALAEDHAELADELESGAEGLAVRVLDVARESGFTLGTAESCTGGLVAGTLTSVPGSSQAFRGGIVSYSNEVKETRLGVGRLVLEKHGAVSELTACQMAEGARKSLGCSIAVSTTGIAGPGGGSAEKPVGTVWIGLSDENITYARVHHFDGDRDSIRNQAVKAALEMMALSIETRNQP